MEQWQRWVPEKEIPRQLHHISTYDCGENVQFLFTDEKEEQTMIFRFDDTNLLTYRETEEGNFLRTVDQKHIHQVISESHGWALFTVQNSQYIRWLQQQSLNTHKLQRITHYVFYTWDVVIEVLSLSSPRIIFKQR